MLVIVTWIISFMLLHVAHLFWQLYLETMMGQEFCLTFPNRAERIDRLFRHDLLPLSGRMTFAAFFISMGVAAILRLIHLHRYLYMSLGIIGKLLCWGLPLTGLTAFYMHERYEISLDWGLTLLVTAVPAYCLFMRCFHYTERLVPEAEDVWGWGARSCKKVPGICKQIIERIRTG